MTEIKATDIDGLPFLVDGALDVLKTEWANVIPDRYAENDVGLIVVKRPNNQFEVQVVTVDGNNFTRHGGRLIGTIPAD